MLLPLHYLFWGGINCYAESLNSYLKTKKNIRKYGSLDEESVQRHSKNYCNRQGARTAAVGEGSIHKEKFDEIVNNYEGHIDFRNLPHL